MQPVKSLVPSRDTEVPSDISFCGDTLQQFKGPSWLISKSRREKVEGPVEGCWSGRGVGKQVGHNLPAPKAKERKRALLLQTKEGKKTDE